jgi:hypothetical protein
MARYTQDGRADRVTGDMHQGQDAHTVSGRIINDGVPLTCSTCDGQSGWTMTGGETIHQGCGSVQ